MQTSLVNAVRASHMKFIKMASIFLKGENLLENDGIALEVRIYARRQKTDFSERGFGI